MLRCIYCILKRSQVPRSSMTMKACPFSLFCCLKSAHLLVSTSRRPWGLCRWQLWQQQQSDSGTGDSGEAVSSSSVWLWLTLSAPSAAAPPAASWWIIISKKCPEKVIPLNKTPPIHTSKERPDIGLWGGKALTKAWEKVLSSKSHFPKGYLHHMPLYHDKGRKIVNGVCLIFPNRWHILVNAYVHNYAWELSTVWLNRSDNSLVSCLVVSSVLNITVLPLKPYAAQNIKHFDRENAVLLDLEKSTR